MSKKINLRIIQRKNYTKNLAHFVLEANDASVLPKFQAGQFMTVEIPSENKNIRRCYSFASWTSNPKTYELGIKREENGIGSNWIFENLTENAEFTAYLPEGQFTLKKFNFKKSYVFIAGGIGVTPLRAMVHEFLSDSAYKKKNLTLIYAVRESEDIMFHEEFIDLAKKHSNFQFIPTVEFPKDEWRGETGRLNNEIISKYVGNLSKSVYYFCARQEMMDSLMSGLEKSGVKQKSMFHESFTIEESDELNTEVDKNAQFHVNFKGEKEFDYQGEDSFYAAMEKNGILPDGFCTQGICGMCAVRLKSGDVQWLRKPQAYYNEGEILPCSCVPKSDIEVERVSE